MQNNNLLMTPKLASPVVWLLFFLFGIGIGVLANVSSLAVVVLLFGLFVILLAKNIEWGLIGILLFGFFHSWQIDFSRYMWAREIEYLPDINAPVVDFLAVAILCALILLGIIKTDWFKQKIKELLATPGFGIYVLFLLSVLVSSYLAYGNGNTLVFKSWLRPYVFVYLAFVAAFIFGIKNGAVFPRFFKIIAGVGGAVAVFGALSLLVSSPAATVWRVTPFGIGSFAPLGYNHNLLAEVLVTTVPAFFILASLHAYKKQWYWYAAVGMSLIAMLTLSRAAWLALAVTFVVWLVAYHKHNLKNFFFQQGPWFKALVIAALVGLGGYMVYFLGTGTSLSSTAARWEVSKAVALYVSRAPWFGYGPGSYTTIVGETALLQLEFGDPLDAHGFVQKIIIETGIVGLVLFVGFLLVLIRVLYRALMHAKNEFQRVVFSGLLAMMMGSIVFQLFNTSYLNSVFWIPVALASAALVYVRRYE